MDFISRLMEAMFQHGFYIDGNIDYNKDNFQRFAIKSKKASGKPLFVKIIGEGKGAVFGDWHNRDSWITWWEKNWGGNTPTERYERAKQMERVKERERIVRDRAIQSCKSLWELALFNGNSHPYVKAKKIIGFYSRMLRSYLLIPITNVNGALQSLQAIKPNGFKQFKKNAPFSGGMLIMAEDIQENDVIRVCEGYATACSIYEVVGPPVVVAFNSHNLTSVACDLRIKYPNNQIHICGDNDQWKKENVGLKNATKAAKLSDAKVVLPDFKKFDVSSKPTDWNDLYCLAGIEEVEQQLMLFRKSV